jgi:hypothetical protein
MKHQYYFSRTATGYHFTPFSQRTERISYKLTKMYDRLIINADAEIADMTRTVQSVSDNAG